MKLSEILNIQPGITALIGGGGKTTMMQKLTEELSAQGKVIIGTSTKIMIPDHIPVLTDIAVEKITEALQKSRVICVGTLTETGKLSAPAIPFSELAKLADYVIVEADGAHRLPIKAHANYEPVIPDGTDKVILLIGADCFGKTISEICHRPELFASIAETETSATVTPELVKRVIEREGLGDLVYINKVEDEKNREYTRELKRLLDMPVFAGSLLG